MFLHASVIKTDLKNQSIRLELKYCHAVIMIFPAQLFCCKYRGKIRYYTHFIGVQFCDMQLAVIMSKGINCVHIYLVVFTL